MISLVKKNIFSLSLKKSPLPSQFSCFLDCSVTSAFKSILVLLFFISYSFCFLLKLLIPLGHGGFLSLFSQVTLDAIPSLGLWALSNVKLWLEFQQRLCYKQTEHRNNLLKYNCQWRPECWWDELLYRMEHWFRSYL